MLVRILVFINHHIVFLWNIVEYFNARIFCILYLTRLNKILGNTQLMTGSNGIQFKYLREYDMELLADFFYKQPISAFEYFRPHGFDIRSLRKKNKDKSFIMIGAFCNDLLVGYCFIRCFFNQRAFRGKIVDKDFQGKGIAKQMGILTSEICRLLRFRLFATISKDNVRSIASSKAVNEMRIVKELPDNYLYVEYILKDSNDT